MANETERNDFLQLANECYDISEQIVKDDSVQTYIEQNFTLEDANEIYGLGSTKHAARGVVLTLAFYKALHFDQDVRYHKSEFDGGFSARSFDTAYTVPFLAEKGLPYNVETHWLSQSLSFVGPLTPDQTIKLVPKCAGPFLISVANHIQGAQDIDRVKSIIKLLLIAMIEERNKGRIPLAKPKNLSIDSVMMLIHKHFSQKYTKNAPRLPQVAIYAIYKCLMADVDRYAKFELKPLEKMRTANRKSGSVGDIDLCFEGRPIEAVEIKFEIEPSASIVSEAIQKVKSESVQRYFILSTKPPVEEDLETIQKLKDSFLKSNGCEIIVNGVYDTLKYYLRLLKTTNDFINNYTDLLSIDEDLNYEHKVAWNVICEETLG